MKKKWFCLLAALALAIGAMAARPAWSVAASPLDLKKNDCTLTVNLEDPNKSDKFGEDLQSAGVVVDVYRIASAVEVPGYDIYRYQPEAPYTGLAISENPTAAQWEALAQEAAKIILEEERNGTAPDKKTLSLTQLAVNTIDHLDTGLYLLLAHGENLSNYMVEIEEKQINENGQERIETRLATVANSGRCQYLFEPQLVSIPGRPDAGTGDGAAADGSAAGAGEWIYDIQVNLKPEQGPLYGALEIVKTLLSYDTAKDSPMFVFEITATLDGEEVYQAYESLTFTEAGQQSITVTGIPVGASVTVTEVYSGAGYRAEGATSQDGLVIMPEPDIVRAEFTNTDAPVNTGGHGIRNHFTYTEDGWQWTTVPGPVGAVVPAKGQEGLQI